MRKIINSTFVSLDGVQSNPQNWHMGYLNDELNAYSKDLLFSSDALVMGRLTYDGFAGAWSSRAGQDEFADRFNSMAKYVASTTLETADWNNSTVLKGDVAAEIARIKEQPGQNILQYGVGRVTRLLIENGLLDELRLWVHPVFVGATGSDDLLAYEGFEAKFELADVKTFDTGVVIQTFRPIK